ncbi:hypothetical protein pqer_cds_715 [Pandoravirus quercus]|uniref:Uncharacterized protein n=1 Tax=Pandoravirus quercus TaxID=2107709 RepID=A0A2U7U9L5_9VIRU|nr:hypothetical protein pqer_cds_715 [Pandoravirus quercus]AVK75137.1 hypothetical protein pqer_cds_715 [Pandoravirus quercus]
MAVYYAYYCWREGPTFVRRHCCDGDTNPIEARYCLVDTIDEVIDFVDAMQCRQKNGQRNTYGEYIEVGHVVRVDAATGTVMVKDAMKELGSNDWTPGNKRRLVTRLLDKAAALPDHYITQADTHRERWSPAYDLSDFCLVQTLE